MLRYTNIEPTTAERPYYDIRTTLLQPFIRFLPFYYSPQTPFVVPLLAAVLFQQFPTTIVFQNLHLLDGNLIEPNESFTLWHTIINQYCIDVLHVREAD